MSVLSYLISSGNMTMHVVQVPEKPGGTIEIEHTIKLSYKCKHSIQKKGLYFRIRIGFNLGMCSLCVCVLDVGEEKERTVLGVEMAFVSGHMHQYLNTCAVTHTKPSPTIALGLGFLY